MSCSQTDQLVRTTTSGELFREHLDDPRCNRFGKAPAAAAFLDVHGILAESRG